MYYALCNLHRAHTNHTSFALDEHARQWRVSCTSVTLGRVASILNWEGSKEQKYDGSSGPSRCPQSTPHSMTLVYQRHATLALCKQFSAKTQNFVKESY